MLNKLACLPFALCNILISQAYAQTPEDIFGKTWGSSPSKIAGEADKIADVGPPDLIQLHRRVGNTPGSTGGAWSKDAGNIINRNLASYGLQADEKKVSAVKCSDDLCEITVIFKNNVKL